MSGASGERGPRIGARLPLVCAVAVAICAAWALMPLGEIEASSAAATPARTVVSSLSPPRTELDLAAFRVPVWVVPAPPPPPPRPEPPPPPPPPLKLQLLAIIRDADGFKASIYDPDADRIVLVGVGDAIEARTVASITEDAVKIRDGEREHTLVLDHIGPPAGGRR